MIPWVRSKHKLPDCLGVPLWRVPVALCKVELNKSYDFNKITEAGAKLKPLSGPGYTGIKNLGNSCYINSCLQARFAPGWMAWPSPGLRGLARLALRRRGYRFLVSGFCLGSARALASVARLTSGGDSRRHQERGGAVSVILGSMLGIAWLYWVEPTQHANNAGP